MAKRFFYVCAGLFLLALSWHLGARSAGANGGHGAVIPLGIDVQNHIYVMTAEGDVYSTPVGSGLLGNPYGQYAGNFWGGKPVPVTPETWGGLKARYRQGGGK